MSVDPQLLTESTKLIANGLTLGYLDPGLGSMIVSAVVGVLASVALGMKTYWYKLKPRAGKGRRAAVGRRAAQHKIASSGPIEKIAANDR